MAFLKSLNDLIDTFVIEIRDAFYEAIRDINNNAKLEEIENHIRNGNIDAAIRATSLDENAFRPFTRAIEDAYEAGGIFTANQFERPVDGALVRFGDFRNSNAEAYIRDQSSTLVTGIVQEARDNIRVQLLDNIAAGTNPKEAALDLVGRYDSVARARVGGIIGLNAPQATALRNAGRDLDNLSANYFTRELRDRRFDSVVRKAIANGTPLTPLQRERILQKYSDNLLRWRGETIARTESIAAMNAAQMKSVDQLIASGNIDPQDVKRIWETADNGPPNGRSRHTHVEMNGQTVGYNEPFISPAGSRLMYPGDTSLAADPSETINCRCVNRIEIDYFRKLNERNAKKRTEQLT